MSSKLDQSLEEIAGSRRTNTRGRGNRRGGKPAGPAGGVTKKAAVPKGPKAAAQPAVPALSPRGESKIIVSNSPDDVTEQQIKEYFGSTVGAVRKVTLNYNKNGRSSGVANIIFAKPESAAEAAKSFNGVKVDGRPMKIEVLVGAKSVAPPPAPKGSGERIAKPKDAPKPANKPKKAGDAPKAATAQTAVSARGGRKGRGRGGRAGRPKPKTVEELDAEMQDYFVPGTATENAAASATGSAAPAATNGGEATMEDEIL